MSSAPSVRTNPLPREIVDGIHWLGDCLDTPWRGDILHSYNSVYVVQGTDASLLVEGGIPKDGPLLLRQLAEVLDGGGPPLRYVFTTHAEVAHASGVGHVLAAYPDAELCGDVRDFHLVFPEFADRMRMLDVGARIPLGGTEFVLCPAVIKDLNGSQWGFDTKRRVFFPGDGFAYSHYHSAGQCGHTAEEVTALPIPQMTALFADLALHWTRFAEMGAVVAALEAEIARLGVELVAPTHGLPITNLTTALPKIREGLLLGSTNDPTDWVFPN
jgi:flavorubredoxin